METTRGPPYPLNEWRTLELAYRKAGLSRYQAHGQIGKLYGVSRSTVYKWLTPEVLHKIREYKHRADVKAKRRAYRKTPVVRARERAYQRFYKRAYRRLADLVKELYEERHSISLEELRLLLYERTGINFQERTLKPYLPLHTEEDVFS